MESGFSPTHLVELLRWRALEHPERRAYTFLADGEQEQARLSYAELDRELRAVGATLQAHGAAGERVLLLYPPGLDYICAFLGCLYAGAIAVPAYPPRRNRTLGRLQAIVADAQPTLALTTDSIRSAIQPMVEELADLGQLRWLVTPIREDAAADDWREPAIDGDTLAFLQYTSGSTSTPKGVMVSHGNLLYNERMIQMAYGHSHETVFAGWLPLYHDMGLIGNVLQPLFLGIPSILMSPVDFLQQPLRWLRAISRYRATTSGAPNFAYDLCVHRIRPEDRSELDLSSWSVAFNGAEPVRDETLEKFAATFAECGFRRQAFCPCYGLAEATLLASGGPRTALPTVTAVSGNALGRNWVVETAAEAADARRLVGCGSTWLEQRIMIADPETLTRCPADRVGEIWLAGPNVARGYWNRPQETAATFGVRLADSVSPPCSPRGDSGEGPFLRTGDLGFLRDGELFVTGRLKDLIIIRGVNHYPQDIEHTAEHSHQGLRLGCNAAFSVEIGGEERLILAQELRRDYRNPDVEEVARAVRQAVSEEHETLVHTVVLIGYASIAKTSSGKIQRHACRAAFLDGSLKVVGKSVFAASPDLETCVLDRHLQPVPIGVIGELYTAPRTETEARLAEIWSRVLGIDRIGVEDNFFALGGDSILSIQVVARANEIGIALTARQAFEEQTIAELAAVAGRRERPTAHQGQVVGEVPLTPIQHWFFERRLADPRHWNQALLLAVADDLAAGLRPASWRRAARHLVAHHDALRLRFRPRETGWRQHVAEAAGATPAGWIDLSALAPARQDAALAAEAERLQASLDLAAGPLLRLAWFRRGRGRGDRLLAVVHHLAVDGVSWRILLEDLAAACRQLAAGRPLRLPPKTTSYKLWAERLQELAAAEESEAELERWLDEPRDTSPLPLDLAAETGADVEAAARTISVALGEQETRALLKEVPRAYPTRIDEVLLAALARALGEWTGAGAVLVEVEGHGRRTPFEDVDLSRTVGWFTNLFPVLLEAGTGGEGETLKAVKERLRRFSRRGLSYGLLRYLGHGEAGEELRRLPRAEVSFNYLGQLDQVLGEDRPWALAPEPAGATRSPRAERRWLLEINAGVIDGRLRLDWSYSTRRHRRETIAGLAERFIEALRALIAHCLAPEAGGYTPSDFPLARLGQAELDRMLATERGVEDLYPLTPMQQGMLFHSLDEAGLDEYVVQVLCRLRGALDVAALEGAWRRVVRRHPVLRTSLRWQELTEAVQIVHDRIAVDWRQEDWRQWRPAEHEHRLEELLADDRRRGYRLDRAPLLRLVLLRLADTEHQLVWSFHHLILDGWSVSLVLKEVLAGYAARRRGEEPRLERGRPYREYVAWLARQDLARSEAHWRQLLRGFAAPTPLGLDQPPDPGPMVHGQCRRWLTPETTAALLALAREQHLTPSTVAQGAWALLLHRYSGERDVVFGITVSGRPPRLPGVESMVGLFINTLPVRVAFPPRQPLLPWLAGLREQVVELQQLEHTPLVKVEGWSEVPRGQPLFHSILIFENYPIDHSLKDTGRELTVAEARSVEWTNYPLSLTVLPGERFELEIVYDRRRFDETEIRRLLGHLERTLTGMAEDPARPPGSVPLLTLAEERQLVSEWNDTRAARRPAACIHQRFEELVERRPERPAVVEQMTDGTLESWTYRELDRRAGLLASHLCSLGVGPETLVGLCLERSREMVAAHLGVLKAGAAYLPLDPTYPRQRLAFMLEDGRVPVLITQERLLDILPEHRARVVLVDADWPRIAGENDGAPPAVAVPENLCQVIYTSGSTALPKAVMISHRQLAQFVDTVIHEYGLRPGDRMLQFCSISFDAATEELYTCYTVGGTLVLRDGEMMTSTARFLERCRDLGVTVLDLPTAFWHQINADLEASEELRPPAELRSVIIGGERAIPERLATWLERASPETRLINSYGPSEATIVATVYVPRPGGGPWREIPIGRPILNARVHILDRELRPVPIGIPGELLIGGAGVTRGYLRRPALTAEKFVPDPWSEEPGERLYRTGDLARRLTDGAVEFVGRIDHQVKLRGFRVELGEIEAALLAHPEVRQAVVRLWEDPASGRDPGTRRLVAYVVPEPSAAASPEGESSAPEARDLRRFLEDRLPPYMVPATFVRLAALPLTLGGSKVDRRALPAPDWQRPEIETSYLAPRTPIENRLAEIWSAVLGISEVGIEDGFFELGGDSILSIQAAARAQQAGLRFTPRQLFEHQTIAELAAVVETVGPLLAEQGPVSGEVPLTPVQHWFFEQHLPRRGHWNQALLLTVAPAGGEVPDAATLERALGALVEHHDALRLRFAAADGGWRQVNATAEETPVFSTCELAGLDGEEQRRALEARAAEAQASLDLAAGPLLRTVYFDLGEEREALLLIAIHHLAVDGVSWRILFEDLTAACRQLRSGEAIALPAKTTSFQRWAERLAELARSPELEGEAGHWAAVNEAQAVRLPLDFPARRDLAADDVEASTRRVTVALDGEETRALLQEVPQAYQTRINDALLTALARSLARFTGGGTLRLELEGHGREPLFDELDVSRTVGWFTTVFPVLLRPPSAAGVGEALKSIKEQLRAVPRNGIGYGLLRYLGRDGEIAESLGRAPAAEVGFNYLGQLDPAPGEAPLFALADEPRGPDRDPQGARSYLLEIEGSVVGGRLELVFMYSERLHREATIARLAEDCLAELRALIEHCRSLTERHYTPSDFSQMDFDQEELDGLIDELAGAVEDEE